MTSPELFCDICGRLIDADVVVWRELPSGEDVPCHPDCDFTEHTCEGMTGDN